MYRARHHFLRCANGDPIHVYEWGEGPRTALILHGWGSHAARFTTMVRALTDRGWRVLAPDAPGHGESHGSTSSLPQFIGAMDARDGAARPRAGADRPFHGIAGDCHAPVGCATARARLDRSPWCWSARLRAFPSWWNRSSSCSASARPRAATCLALFAQRFGGRPEDFMALGDGARIDLPVLLVHDEADDVVPCEHSRQLLSRLPGARLLTTHGLGHSGMLRDPPTIAAIADFLDQPRIARQFQRGRWNHDAVCRPQGLAGRQHCCCSPARRSTAAADDAAKRPTARRPGRNSAPPATTRPRRAFRRAMRSRAFRPSASCARWISA